MTPDLISDTLEDWYESEDTVTREEVLAQLRDLLASPEFIQDGLDRFLTDEDRDALDAAIALLSQPAASEEEVQAEWFAKGWAFGRADGLAEKEDGQPAAQQDLWKVRCPVCEGRGELREAVQAWDILGAPVPRCPYCAEGTIDLAALIPAAARQDALRDTERLDWLEQHGSAMYSAIEMDHDAWLEGHTIREAIDKARAALAATEDKP